MGIFKEIKYLSNTLKNSNDVLYDNLARNYLLYFGNKDPSVNQIIVFKKLLIDSFFKELLTFPEKLTLSEMKCLYLAFRGVSIKSAAQILGIHSDTIKSHRKRSIKKLGCKNIVEAAFKSSELHFQDHLCEKLFDEYVRNIKFLDKKITTTS